MGQKVIGCTNMGQLDTGRWHGTPPPSPRPLGPCCPPLLQDPRPCPVPLPLPGVAAAAQAVPAQLSRGEEGAGAGAGIRPGLGSERRLRRQSRL